MEIPKDKESQNVNKAVETFNRILDAARKSVYAKVLDHSQKFPNSPWSGAALVDLERTLTAFYGSLGKELKGEFRATLPKTMQAFYDKAAKDIASSGDRKAILGAPDTDKVKYFMQDAWDRVAGRTQKMRIDHIRQLRGIAASVYQKASVTGMTTKQASQEAMSEALKIPGFNFVDRAGRYWPHKQYFDMLARTELMNAGRATYDAKVAKEGYDVMLLSVSGEPCPACAAFEGRLFSLTGATKNLPSKADLEKAGVFHPNCTHSYSAAPDYVVETDFDENGRPKEGFNSQETHQKDMEKAAEDYKEAQGRAPSKLKMPFGTTTDKEKPENTTTFVTSKSGWKFPADDEFKPLRPFFDAAMKGREEAISFLKNQAAKEGVEYALTYDHEGNLYSVARGGPTAVHVPIPNFAKEVAHNHPEGGTFSQADLENSIIRKRAQKVLATSPKGDYSLTLKDGGRIMNTDEFKARLREAKTTIPGDQTTNTWMKKAWQKVFDGTGYEYQES